MRKNDIAKEFKLVAEGALKPLEEVVEEHNDEQGGNCTVRHFCPSCNQYLGYRERYWFNYVHESSGGVAGEYVAYCRCGQKLLLRVV